MWSYKEIPDRSPEEFWREDFLHWLEAFLRNILNLLIWRRNFHFVLYWQLPRFQKENQPVTVLFESDSKSPVFFESTTSSQWYNILLISLCHFISWSTKKVDWIKWREVITLYCSSSMLLRYRRDWNTRGAKSRNIHAYSSSSFVALTLSIFGFVRNDINDPKCNWEKEEM